MKLLPILGLSCLLATSACTPPGGDTGEARKDPGPSPPASSSPAPAAPPAQVRQVAAATAPAPKAVLLPALVTFAASLGGGFDAIPADRRAQLERLAAFVKTRRDSGEIARIVYICTHNSRRSHMGQLFSTLAAAHYGVDRVETFSGGTEATAFNPRAVAALERIGFEIENPGGKNPLYAVKFAENRPPAIAFSKKYDDAANPKEGFAAVMTCSQADTSCPLVPGAAIRVPLHYEDPKTADDTPAEAGAYDERARQIATEAFYLFSRVGS